MKKFKEAVLLAAHLREDSYDHDKASRVNDFVDFSKFCKLTIYEATKKAAGRVGISNEYIAPIHLLLLHSWNEAISWADSDIY